jgi:hypothetical protein
MQFQLSVPAKGTKTGRIWELAERISFEKMRTAKRQEVIDVFVGEGGNANTASTQYSQWKSQFDATRLQNVAGLTTVALNVSAMRLELGRDGRLLLPLELRSALRLGDELLLTAEVNDGVLTIMSPRTAMMQLQNLVRQQDQGTGSVVDELLAERRAESKAE